jgi:plasmid stability protein
MPTLYVENVPKELYEGLRNRARKHRRSIAAEVLSLLEEVIPTKAELKARRQAFHKLERLRFTSTIPGATLPSSLEMIREDRER